MWASRCRAFDSVFSISLSQGSSKKGSHSFRIVSSSGDQGGSGGFRGGGFRGGRQGASHNELRMDEQGQGLEQQTLRSGAKSFQSS